MSSKKEKKGSNRGDEDEIRTPPEENWKPNRGATVWVVDPEECFKKTLVFEVEGDQVETEAGVFGKKQVFPINPDSQDGVPDNTMMDFLYDANLLHNLSYRYDRDQIYSYIAYILIAINPYKTLPIYDEETMWMYRKGSMGSLPPHVFAISERAFRHMAGSKVSQSIVCSGDSGAGKTETAKYLLRYLTTIAGGGADSQLEKRILEANPIIEAFGNAKTLRNNNSSRFGKFVRVHFSVANKVIGADITTYLLEKSRLANQPTKERNFHIFYQMLTGATKDERNAWGLEDFSVDSFRYTNQSKCTQIENVDDKDEFRIVREAMTCAGMSPAEQSHVLALLSALLFLGNITFEEYEKENAEASRIISSDRVWLDKFCRITQTPPKDIENALLQRTIFAKDSTYIIPLKKPEAEFARDTLAKAIYGRLFNSVVNKINSGMPIEGESKNFIGILDISGFEYFENNGFEQFLINYCNEKIQQYFITQILQAEQQIYLQEGLTWKTVRFDDNFKCIELIELKTHGVLALLQEQSMLPKGTDERFTMNLTKVMVTNEKLVLISKVPKKSNIPGLGGRRFRNEDAFIIKHFAANVCYQTKGWLGKNNDSIHKDLFTVIQKSKSRLLLSLFPVAQEEEGEPLQGQGKGEKKSGRFATISNKFYQDLTGLMQTLNLTESSFIRCINPNLHRKPGLINREGVLTQLRCSGMLEALRIMQAGFPTRCLFTDLYSRYRKYCPPEIANLNPKLFSEALLVALDLVGGEDFQMGLSRVFFRAGKAAMMDDIISGDPGQMQRVVEKIRKWLCRKRWRQYAWAVVAIGRLGALIEDLREERRRLEEERRLASEEYKRELKRKQEEEERLLREELLRKEEEERRRAEEEERRRKLKLEKKLAKEKELQRLKDEAEEKKDLQLQLQREQEMYEEVKSELMEEIAALELELDHQQEERLELERELAATRSRERALLEMKNLADSEIEKLRQHITELQDELARLKAHLRSTEEYLHQEREKHKLTIISWEKKYQDMMDRKDAEIERMKQESERQIAGLKEEMQQLMDEMKAQLERELQRAQEEKEESITRVEVIAEEKLTVMEKKTAKVSKSGYMWKHEEGLLKSHWKKLYFVLKSNFLSWYSDQNQASASGMIDLENSRVYKTQFGKKEKDKKKYEGREFEIRAGERVVEIRVDYARDCDAWIQAISMAKARHLASGTVNLDKVSVAAVKQGLVGGNMSMYSPRDC